MTHFLQQGLVLILQILWNTSTPWLITIQILVPMGIILIKTTTYIQGEFINKNDNLFFICQWLPIVTSIGICYMYIPPQFLWVFTHTYLVYVEGVVSFCSPYSLAFTIFVSHFCWFHTQNFRCENFKQSYWSWYQSEETATGSQIHLDAPSIPGTLLILIIGTVDPNLSRH